MVQVLWKTLTTEKDSILHSKTWNFCYHDSKQNQYKLNPGWYGLVGWSIVPNTKRWRAQFSVRAHIQVAGSIPDWGTCRRQPINVVVFIPLSKKNTPKNSSNNKNHTNINLAKWEQKGATGKLRAAVSNSLTHPFCTHWWHSSVTCSYLLKRDTGVPSINNFQNKKFSSHLTLEVVTRLPLSPSSSEL